MCVYCFREIVILPFFLFPQPWHIWSAMQCSYPQEKKKKKKQKNFPPVFNSQDNVHSKQHIRSLFRELKCTLFLCSKNVIFQRKCVREKGRKTHHFVIEYCTFYIFTSSQSKLPQMGEAVGLNLCPFQLNYCILKSFIEAQMSIPQLHSCTSAQHYYPSLKLCRCRNFAGISHFTFPPNILW